MTTAQLSGVLRRHWLLVAGTAVLGAVAGAAVAMFLVTPTYSSTVKLYVAGTGDAASDRVQNGEYARTHISSYTDMITSTDMFEAVRQDLGLPTLGVTGSGDLAGSITASNPLNTLVIDVTVTDADPDRAVEIARAIGDVANDLVSGIESPPDGRNSPVRVEVVGPPERPTAPISPDRTIYAAGGLVAGLAVGIGAAALIDVSKPGRSRRAEERAARRAQKRSEKAEAQAKRAADKAAERARRTADKDAKKAGRKKTPADDADPTQDVGRESSGGAHGDALGRYQAEEHGATRA